MFDTEILLFVKHEICFTIHKNKWTKQMKTLWRHNTFVLVARPLTFKSQLFKSHSWRGVLDTTLFDKVCSWLATGLWFSLCTPISSTNKTDCHDIIEMLLRVALNITTHTLNFKRQFCNNRYYRRVCIFDDLNIIRLRFKTISGAIWSQV